MTLAKDMQIMSLADKLAELQAKLEDREALAKELLSADSCWTNVPEWDTVLSKVWQAHYLKMADRIREYLTASTSLERE